MLFLKWEEALETHILDKLGPLQKLIGVWEGEGFTIIARPDGKNRAASDDPNTRIAGSFQLQLNTTREILVFIPILGKIINRGFEAQPDISVYGLMYIQFIVDAADITNILHFENGQWLLMPATTVPNANAMIVRQATILHGATFIAQGDAANFDVFTNGPPNIPSEESRPSGIPFDAPYLKPYQITRPPPGIIQDSITNPNRVLQIKAAKLPPNTKTASITLVGSISPSSLAAGVATPPTSPSGSDRLSNTQPAPPLPSDVTNTPFLRKNAEVQNLNATFYVETVTDSNNNEIFKQLQYTQKTFRKFEDINWPHIAVATLRHSQFPDDVGGVIARLLGSAFRGAGSGSR
jgi:hypothetical protein